ncbi:MAG: single-stranded DNA-binding protein, partial [Deltaproteobacteria bacterium]|nr:single-stranded DNA-binding protein [Deltaproteobacteria bacterium]
EGRIQTRSWEDKDGVKRSTTEIVAANMQMLDSKGQVKTQDAGLDDHTPTYSGSEQIPDDDVPF